MDSRTMIRELEEVITRAQSATEREALLVKALPEGGLQRRKQRQVRSMRAHLQRLQRFQTTVKSRGRSGSRLY
jgi:hypothetical protein